MLIGVDIGSTAVKAALFDDRGAQIRVARVACPSALGSPGEFDPERWWLAACEALRGLRIDTSEMVAAIGVCGRGGTCVLLGEEGELLGPSWDDRREVEQLRSVRDEFGDRIGPRATGLLAKARWWSEHEGPVWRVCSAKDYVVYRLTGNLLSDAASGGSEVGFWPPLAEAHAAWSQAGTISRAAALDGLARGIPVAVGWHDGAAATFGSGGAEEGCAAITLGTNAVYRTVTREIPPSLRKYWDLTPGLTVTGGDITAAGRAHEWANVLLRGDPAVSPPGSNGVLFLPQTAGRIAPDVRFDVRAGWHGLEIRHSADDMLRSVDEGIAFSLRQLRDWLAGEGLVAKRSVATGGGARVPLQAQMVADVLGKSIEVPLCEEGCRGAALLGAVAAGALTIDEAVGLRPETATYQPDDAIGEIYEVAYRRWLKLQRATDSATEAE